MPSPIPPAGASGRLSKRFIRRRLIALGAIAAVVIGVSIGVSQLVERDERPVVVASDASAGAAVETDVATVPEAAPAAPIAVFIGDSYTVGQGTALEGVGFTALLAERRGWEPVNIAISGTGYAASHELDRCGPDGCPAYAGVLDEAAAAGPDIVVVSGGRNDMWLPDQEQVAVSIAEFYAQLRAAFPTEHIIVTSPLWGAGPTPDGLLTIRETVALEAARIGANYLDLGDLFEMRPDLITADKVHPTEAGLELIATTIDELLDSQQLAS
nr:SGNH/GDSL hydrolase family protein [Agrococcus sp. KRD186]